MVVAGAGGATHLHVMVAAMTAPPVIGAVVHSMGGGFIAQHASSPDEVDKGHTYLYTIPTLISTRAQAQMSY